MSSEKKRLSVRKLCTNPYMWILLITGIMYAVLYGNFIFGEKAYFYSDIGSDTININYPLYCLFSDVLHGRGYSNYFMNVGLGMDMSSYVFQYLNPLNLLIVILPQRLIAWGVIGMVYIKLLIIGIFGYKFFYKLIRNQWGALTAALVWTFSSYVTLWGQHFGFCTAMVMFTVFMYLVHIFVEDSEKSRNWILVPWLTMLLFTNYYFLYMIGIIGAMYIVVYLICRKASWKKIVVKLLGLAGMGILGICIGGVCLIPTLTVFWGSARSGAVDFYDIRSLFSLYPEKWLYSSLARMISNNVLNIANDYMGAGNYYEVAMLSTSSLFFLAVPRLLAKKGLRLRTIFLIVLSLAALSFPFTGKFFNMNPYSFRWCFVLCFMEALAIGVFVKLLLEEENKKAAGISAGAGIFLAAAVCALVFAGQEKEFYEIETEYVTIFAVFLAVYCIGILIYNFLRDIPGMRRVFPVILTAVVCIELIVINYPTVNERENPTRSELALEYYNDGTKEAYAVLREQDDSLYRVAKNYISCSENDSMVQGYSGLAVYMTTNQKELLQLQSMYGGLLVGQNNVDFGSDNYFFNSLMGMKYMFSNVQTRVSESDYTYLTTVGTKSIYRNNNALPFGYLYHQSWEKEQIQAMTERDRALAALHGFYYTDEDEVSSYPQAERNIGSGISLMDRDFQMNDCQAERTEEGIRISDMKEDPFIVFNNLEEDFGDGAVHMIAVEVNVSEPIDMAVYYKKKSEEAFSGEQIYIFDVSPESPVWKCAVPADINDLRIDVSDKTAEVTVKNVEIINCESDNLALEELKSSDVTQAAFENDTYHATVNNTMSEMQMLCVPLLYSGGWVAEVDGVRVKLCNINNGLCGVEISPGSHEVTLHYEIPHEMIGIGLSVAGICVYFAWIAAGIVWNRKKCKYNL